MVERFVRERGGGEVGWRWSGHILDTFDSAGALCMGSDLRKRSPDRIISANGRFPDARFTSSKNTVNGPEYTDDF